MAGLDYFGIDEVGFDWMNLAKGATAALSGTPGAGGKDTAVAAAEKQKLLDEKVQAEQSASRLKLILIFLGVLVGAGGIAALVVGRRA